MMDIARGGCGGSSSGCGSGGSFKGSLWYDYILSDIIVLRNILAPCDASSHLQS